MGKVDVLSLHLKLKNGLTMGEYMELLTLMLKTVVKISESTKRMEAADGE